MITASIPPRQMRKLQAVLEGTKKKLPKEAAIAINATAKKVRNEENKTVRTELATTKKAVDKSLSIRGKATPQSLGATVRLAKTRRIPVRDFGARQNKRGVSYKISKTSGRQFAAGAFQGPRPGVMKTSWRGNAFKRAGKNRLPIVKLLGASPWGVFVKQRKTKPMQRFANKELQKQMQRRIKFHLLKKQGAI